jgi:hypothetical protein
MDNSEHPQLYPFAAKCPLCGGHIDGLVAGGFCLGGGGPLAEKVSGLVDHRCNRCGKSIGLRLRLGDSGVAVLESGAYLEMLLSDCAAAIRKRKGEG